MGKIIIKKGSGMTMEADRDQLVTIDQMPDGIIFKFKMGIDLMYTHLQMPLQTKQQIIAASQSFENAVALEIDLHNYAKPVRAILN